jgi:hypothetical protein
MLRYKRAVARMRNRIARNRLDDRLPAAMHLEAPAVHAVAQSPAAPRQATDEQIRLLAYFKWAAAGYPPGDGVAFWLQAERELNKP